jgi:hypothetical protein
LQADEETDVAKDAHLIISVLYALENNIKEDFFLFYKPIYNRDTSLEVFNKIKYFLEQNEMNWEN